MPSDQVEEKAASPEKVESAEDERESILSQLESMMVEANRQQ